MKKIALIVAGGSGERMQLDVPKQFIEFAGKPVLIHTIEKFRFVCDEIIVVLPASQKAYWEKLCMIHHFTIPHRIIDGGEDRIQSVHNGLKQIPDDCLVAIHDGVRPLVEEQLIKQAFDTAELKGNSVLSVKLKDSIRIVSDGISKAQDRAHFVLIQTPQTFHSTAIKNAYEKLFSQTADKVNFTDDASVAEYAGETINLINGSYRNIKITVKEDLKIAEVLFRST